MSSQRTQNVQTRSREDLLLDIVNKSQAVVNFLSEGGAWNIVLDDFKAQIKELDDTWQFVKDDQQMYQFKVTKMAAMSVVNLIDTYRLNSQRASEELKTLLNPDKSIQKDTDNEGEENESGSSGEVQSISG